MMHTENDKDPFKDINPEIADRLKSASVEIEAGLQSDGTVRIIVVDDIGEPLTEKEKADAIAAIEWLGSAASKADRSSKPG